MTALWCVLLLALASLSGTVSALACRALAETLRNRG